MKDKLRYWWSKLAKSTAFWLGLIIVVQTVVYALAGASKAYFHMDEVYSYGLANHEIVQIYETENFYDTWHDGAYYDRYLTVEDGERGDFRPVYQNQRDDVHPPLFYFLLRLGMELTPGQFSKWTGIILNMLIAGVNTIVMYLVIRKLVETSKRGRNNQEKVRALVLTGVVALSFAMVGTVVYIRMYMLLTLIVSVTTYLYLKLLEAKTAKLKLLVEIGVVQLLGALTQYYYWFYVVALFGFMIIYYIRQRRWQEWRGYFATVVGSGLVSLLIWPFAISHMFFGYRGEGVMATLLQPVKLLENLWNYASVLNDWVFNKLLFVIVLGLLLLGAYVLVRRKSVEVSERQGLRWALLAVPTVFYLLIVAAVSPFATLRYIAPVAGWMIVMVMYGVWVLIEAIQGKKVGNILMVGIIAIFGVVMPVGAKLEPDAVYLERAGLIDEFKALQDVPMLYIFKTGNDWGFLNDILLVRELKRSYLAKDIGANEAEIRRILAKEDLGRGLILFVNDDQDKDEVLEAVEKATGLEKVEWTKRIVMSDVYYLR